MQLKNGLTKGTYNLLKIVLFRQNEYKLILTCKKKNIIFSKYYRKIYLNMYKVHVYSLLE